MTLHQFICPDGYRFHPRPVRSGSLNRTGGIARCLSLIPHLGSAACDERRSIGEAADVPGAQLQRNLGTIKVAHLVCRSMPRESCPAQATDEFSRYYLCGTQPGNPEMGLSNQSVGRSFYENQDV